ncbi:phage tail sheath C-terminal domain-containing protein [Fastidiosibacter lacustris]|uniref:phage tail sheath C-terminal domain-containing protein n=1 Tax=Fastidiosibacter lacustris TaxID=2056695 RepID=UPI000E350169|nr:phage tail sheath C-terminal domain-containing protein [Fastidiosibacter lacustris]
MSAFYHGVEVVEIDGGARPIRTVKSSVIGLIGTAPDADNAVFPLNAPVLIAGNRTEAAKLGSNGTLPDAIDGIFDQVGAMVVVVRVDHADDNAQMLANVQGGIDSDTGQRTGVQAFLDAGSTLGLIPRILIAPNFSNEAGIVQELMSIAERLKAVIIAEAPSTTDTAAIAYRKNFGSARVYVIDPRVMVLASGVEVAKPSSPRIAGLMARIDKAYGWHYSPSNHEIYGVTATERAIDFELNGECRANYLNENKIATIINQNGFRLWGNLTCSNDPKWQFLSVRRTADMLNESLLYAHNWAVDRGISKTFVDDIVMSVNGYLRSLVAQGRILGGKCWADPELNSENEIANGHVTFSFDFTPVYPAQHITFNSHLVNDYISEIF